MKKLLLSLVYALAAFFPSLHAAEFTVENLTLAAGQTGQIVVGLNNTETNLSGFQFRLSLPEGLSLTKKANGKFTYTLSERIEYHTLSITELTDGSYQFICYSMDADLIVGNSGELLSISVTADESFSGQGDGELSAVMVTDVDTHTSNCNNVSFYVGQSMVYATGISLNNTALTMTAAGQTATLIATVTPSNATNKSVTWTSSNTDVATVSSTGVVTAKANGSATIAAKTADGTNLTATCTVTVAIPVLATGISLNNTALTLTAVGQTATLIATVTPSNATNKSVTWSSSNTDVATVSSTGVVTAVANGTTVITATTADGTSVSAQCTITVNISDTNNITFLDNNVKALCVANWDFNSDGELSEAEAAAVTDLGEVFKGNTTITSFDELSYFTGLTSICSSAFQNCSGLTSVSIPENVTSIGNDAFKGCSGLTKAEFASIEKVCNMSFENVYSNPLYYAHHLYINGSEVTDLVIPDNVTNIGNNAFRGCNCLTVTIPNSVTSIGIGAFSNCTLLSSVSLSNNIIEISRGLFYECTSLTTVTIPDGVTSIRFAAFQYSGLTSIIIPNSVTLIEGQAFIECSSLTSLTIGSGITDLSTHGFFSGCDNLTKVEYASIESLCGINFGDAPYNNPLYYAKHLYINGEEVTDLVIPDGVTTVRSYAFAGCSSITSVTIPESLTSFGSASFSGCSGITTVKMYRETPTSTCPFGNRSNATLYVPAGCKAAYEAAAYWQDFNIVEMANDEPEEIEVTDISQMDNVIYIESTEERTGTETTISFKMKNMAAIRGFQFNLTLPEGVTPVEEDGEYVYWLNADRAPKKAGGQYYHTLEINPQTDGSYRFLCGSTSDKTFSGTDGEIIVLKVNIANNLAAGEYPVVLKNIKLTETDINNYYETAKVVSKITIIDFVTGDISGDGIVDVSDYIGVANHILGNTPAGFNARAADVNNDNVIDVSDYIGIANIILTGSIYGNNNAAARLVEKNEEQNPQ